MPRYLRGRRVGPGGAADARRDAWSACCAVANTSVVDGRKNSTSTYLYLRGAFRGGRSRRRRGRDVDIPYGRKGVRRRKISARPPVRPSRILDAVHRPRVLAKVDQLEPVDGHASDDDVRRDDVFEIPAGMARVRARVFRGWNEGDARDPTRQESVQTDVASTRERCRRGRACWCWSSSCVSGEGTCMYTSEPGDVYFFSRSNKHAYRDVIMCSMESFIMTKS